MMLYFCIVADNGKQIQIHDLYMNEVENLHFGVLVRAIDIESKVLSTWTTQIPQNLDFQCFCWIYPEKNENPIIPIGPLKRYPAPFGRRG